MRSAFTVSARFLVNLLWIMAKAIIAFIALLLCTFLVGALTEELLEAMGLFDYAYDLAHGIHVGVGGAFIVVVSCMLFCWVSGKKWIADIGPKRVTTSAGPPVARSPAESLRFFAKVAMALLVWVACVSLVGYAVLWLIDDMALEGFAADAADGLFCALWFVVAFAVGFRLQAWVDGERWRGLSHWPPNYQRPDYTYDGAKDSDGALE